MTPRPDETTTMDTTTTTQSSSSSSSSSSKTVIMRPKDAPEYLVCDSPEAFLNPTTKGLTAGQINETLNLNLGQTMISPENVKLIKVIHFLNKILLFWWEHRLFQLLNMVPFSWRRGICFAAWRIYLPIHRALLGRTTGIHPAVSEEYHAMTTIMWWTRLIPVTVSRMRFSLSQLHVWAPHLAVGRVEHVREDLKIPVTATYSVVPAPLKDHCRVQGMFMHRRTANGTKETKPTATTLFWIYGGAFLSGDTLGNSGPADWVGEQCQSDVFVPSYRLCPEATMDEILWDICLAYHWLCQKRDPATIIILGVSSGAALGARLMQFIAEHGRGEPLLPPYVEPLVTNMKMPKAAVLIGPFVDYTEPSTESFKHYPKHDLIVNQRVVEAGIPYLSTHVNGDRKEYSPVHRSFEGLPPLCVVVSEHEAVYDQTIALVNSARSKGVPVTLGVWKYVCHVFCFLNGFVPEGQQSMDFVCDWICRQQQTE
jgi:monoterpene epsilon-lactone hydrolase